MKCVKPKLTDMTARSIYGIVACLLFIIHNGLTACKHKEYGKGKSISLGSFVRQTNKHFEKSTTLADSFPGASDLRLARKLYLKSLYLSNVCSLDQQQRQNIFLDEKDKWHDKRIEILAAWDCLGNYLLQIPTQNNLINKTIAVSMNEIGVAISILVDKKMGPYKKFSKADFLNYLADNDIKKQGTISLVQYKNCDDDYINFEFSLGIATSTKAECFDVKLNLDGKVVIQKHETADCDPEQEFEFINKLQDRLKIKRN